jgi:hypothetical protein
LSGVNPKNKPMKNPTLPVKTRILFLITLVCAAIASVQIVDAATTWTVTNSGDGAANAGNCPGAGCRLRDALAAAADGDTINFSVTGAITLSSGELEVNDSITISGPGANILAVNGNATSRVFYISSGKTVNISGLTITNGHASDVDFGAGIFNDDATLTVSNCTVSGNSAGFGGGIFNDGESGSATLTVNNSTISGNSAGLDGGGIWNGGNSGGSATLTVNNSTVSGNSANGGGGILNNGLDASATVTVNNSPSAATRLPAKAAASSTRTARR